MEELPELLVHLKEEGKIDHSEMADVLILILDVCYLENIDPEIAVYNKLEVLRGRNWVRNPYTGLMQHED